MNAEQVLKLRFVGRTLRRASQYTWRAQRFLERVRSLFDRFFPVHSPAAARIFRVLQKTEKAVQEISDRINVCGYTVQELLLENDGGAV
jgi:hypothetical protein